MQSISCSRRPTSVVLQAMTVVVYEWQMPNWEMVSNIEAKQVETATLEGVTEWN